MNTEETIENWMYNQPKWMQEAMRLLCKKNCVEDLDLTNIKKIFTAEMVDGKAVELDPLSQGWSNMQQSAVPIQLLSIRNPVGINNLHPKRPLEFGTNKLSIVYGVNGSGKSGYVRLLKKLSDPTGKETILQCYFEKKQITQSCDVSFNINGRVENYEHVDLSNPNRTECAHTLDIFDNDISVSYVKGHKAYSFEPIVLTRLSKLTEICINLSPWVDEQINLLRVEKLKYPDHIKDTAHIKYYTNLAQQKDFSSLEKVSTWTDSDESRRDELDKLLRELNPKAKLQILKNQHQAADKLEILLCSIHKKLFNDVQEKARTLYDAMIAAQKAATEAGQIISHQCEFPIEQATWKAMWEEAKKYSELVAYPNTQFPFVGDGAKCPLCQQTLSPNAIIRFKTLNDYVENQLTANADKYSKIYRDYIGTLQISEPVELVHSYCKTLNMNDDQIKMLEDFFTNAVDYVTGLIKNNRIPCSTDLSNLDIIIKNVTQLLSTIKKQEEEFEKVLDSEKRARMISDFCEYDAQKWLHIHLSEMHAEFDKYSLSKRWSHAKHSLNTRNLTEKSKHLSEEIMTDAYIKRFNNELQNLGVKLTVKCKTNGSAGHLYKSLVLVKNDTECDKPEQILSEGEAKIVSLAAFLADATGGYSSRPLIFDDPISSLDYQYEQCVIRRLVKLANERQIIVFTHRLSLKTGLADTSEASGINFNEIEVSTQPWGSGEIRDGAFVSKKCEARLNSIKDTYLRTANKYLANDGFGFNYFCTMKTICSEIRIAIEDLVADVLLCGVVKRFDPAIHTNNGLKNLCVISEADCNLITTMMTKYSFTEHSQSEESIHMTFGPENSDFSVEVISQDIDKLVSLISDLKKRRKTH